MSKHINSDKRVPIESDNVCITRDESKCILCGACRSICKFGLGVYGNYTLEKTGDKAICVGCGQCSIVCPTSAITEVKDYLKVEEILKDKTKTVIFQTSPSVRVGLGELFNNEPGTNVEGKMVAALRKLGASYVLDTTFGADLTIMEEANELIDRIKNKQVMPQFTSCCPAWVRFIETFFPDYIPNLSTVKSPILMQGALIKTYFAEKMSINPANIINVAVTPCTAKKYEINREEMNDSGYRDIDYVITTRELGEWLKKDSIDFNCLEESNYDSLMNKGTGSGLIFGNSGGVMEAAIRTAYYTLTGEVPSDDLLEFNAVRGLTGVKEALISINGAELKIAVINGTFNARKVLKKIEAGEINYDFIEVMACSGGCIAGGGQPKTEIPLPDAIKEARINALYQADKNSKLRNSYENPDIIKIYDEYLTNPLSEISKKLLHTTYNSKAKDLG